MVVFAGNVAPTLEAGADVALNEGETLTRTLTFTDPGADTWTATVDYGDGSEIVTIPAAELDDRAFDLSHTYTDNGAFAVLVRITRRRRWHGDRHVPGDGEQPSTHRRRRSPIGRWPKGTQIVLTANVADAGAGDTARLSMERGRDQRPARAGGDHTDASASPRRIRAPTR